MSALKTKGIILLHNFWVHVRTQKKLDQFSGNQIRYNFSEFPSQTTHSIFKKRSNFLRGQFWVYAVVTLGGSAVFYAMAFFVSELPQFLNSVLKTSDWTSLLLLTLFEGYVFPVALAIVTTSNSLVCITFGGLDSGIMTLNAVLMNEQENKRSCQVNCIYE